MTGGSEIHETSTQLASPAPAQVDAGTDITLKIRVSCSHACDLQGSTVRIAAEDGTIVAEAALVAFEGTSTETAEFSVRVPAAPGEYVWAVVFPEQGDENVLHGESSAPLLFTVTPHATSVAIWDVPSPVPFDTSFRIKVGVKCSSGCKLAGQEIEILDAQGEQVATGVLGDVPWPKTSALYWTEVELRAPAVEGYCKLRAQFAKLDLELPHEEALQSFGFRSGKPPEHLVTVQAVDKETAAPIKDAHVFLPPYRSSTDGSGVASLRVPKGVYQLYVSTDDDHVTFQTTVEITGDTRVRAELLFFEDPFR